MIVSFSVANFRSFSSEETISLVASNRLSGSHEDHAVPIPGSEEKVLRTAVLYGANGAGKSNLFKALRYLRSVALFTRNKGDGTGRQPFRFGEAKNDPSRFDLQFIANEKLYRYGVEVDDERIVEEWLYEVEGGRQRRIYERTTDESGGVSIDAGAFTGAGEKLTALAIVGGPQNQSFLATADATLEASDLGEALEGVLAWFKNGLICIAPDAAFRSLARLLDKDSGFLSFASDFLKSASTGVDHLEVRRDEVSEDELRRLLPETVASKLFQDLAEEDDGATVARLPGNNEVAVERTGRNTFNLIGIRAAHELEPG